MSRLGRLPPAAKVVGAALLVAVLGSAALVRFVGTVDKAIVRADDAKPPSPPPPARFRGTGAAADWQQLLLTADANRGRTIMAAGLKSDVPACTMCHGVNGEPLTGSDVPRLSGQGAWYLAKQLDDYAGNARRNASMTEFSRLLSPQERADVALAWSERSAPYAAPAGAGDHRLVERGRHLVEEGDEALGMRPCASCHAPVRDGAYDPVPSVSGQHPDYVLAALQDWVEGRRRNDVAAVMRTVVARLVPDDRRAVAAYLATKQPPGP